MTGDHHGRSAGRATLLVTAADDFSARTLLQIGGAEIGRLTLQPGWRWSNDVKPIASNYAST